MAIASNVIDQLEVLFWVHMSQTTFLVGINFANYLANQWVFQDDIAETLVMDCFKDSVLVGSVQAHDIH